MPTPLTIVFQPFATKWLGHTSRLIAIAQAIRRKRPDARLPFLSEGNAGPLLDVAGFPYFTLPHQARFAGPEWSGWSSQERDDILNELCSSILNQLQPRVVVFDMLPYPHVVNYVARMKIPAVLVTRKTVSDDMTFSIARPMASLLDRIIVPHNPEEIRIPPDLADKAHHVGAIVRDLTFTPGRDSSTSDSKLIVITGGGGGYAGTVEYYNLAMAAVRAAAPLAPPFKTILITGPMFREWDQLRPVEGIAILPFDPNIGSTYASADVIICQAGYNTMAELSQLGKPTICVPAPRPGEDQAARAFSFAAQWPNLIVFTDSSADLLKQHVVQCLTMPSASAAPVSQDRQGADRAADIILSLADQS